MPRPSKSEEMGRVEGVVQGGDLPEGFRIHYKATVSSNQDSGEKKETVSQEEMRRIKEERSQ